MAREIGAPEYDFLREIVVNGIQKPQKEGSQHVDQNTYEPQWEEYERWFRDPEKRKEAIKAALKLKLLGGLKIGEENCWYTELA